MAIAFSCDVCSSKITVPEHLAGKNGKCPKCGKALTVPKQSVAPDASKEASSFSVASSDLTASKDLVVSGDTTSSDTTTPEPEPRPADKAPAKAASRPATGTRRKEATMRFRCPHCKATLTVPLRVAGQTGKCAACKQSFTAPVPEALRQARARAAAKAAQPASAAPESLRDAFSVVKVKCWKCGVTSAVPRSRVQGEDAACPACDEPLDLDDGSAGGDDDD